MRTHYKKCSVNNPTGLPAATPTPAATQLAAAPGQQPPALTPPNSDQESGVLAPLTRSATAAAAAAQLLKTS